MTEPHSLIGHLERTAQTIRDLEAKAQQALNSGDPDEYKSLLERKCETLEDLPQRLAPALNDLPQDQQSSVESQIAGFAQRAAQALELDSVFFMSALLYPETYQPGAPNDLEAFILTLRSSL